VRAPRAVNMNGTALYEALTVIFLAQAHGVALGPAGVAVVAATATLAAVGAAAIPSAGLVTMLMVLQAVGLGRLSGDLALILSLDWLLDRCRTVVNLLSDVFGTVLVDALCAPPGPAYAALELV
jgi:solute carrier family 1 (high affinity glutamate transporter) protein 2